MAYWQELNPQARISDTPWQATVDAVGWTGDSANDLRMDLAKTGYAVSPAAFDDLQLKTLLAIVLNVVRAGHRPAYALVYDEFYEFFGNVGKYLTQIFRSDVLMVPDEFDVHFVPASERAAGSKPHRDSIRAADYLDEAGVPELLNIWVPLTDASLSNSCIYVLPANHDPAFYQAIAGNAIHWRIDDTTMQAVRALPAKAGTMLFWAPSLLHWGSRSSEKAAAPRVSVACYFQSAKARKFHPTAMPMAGKLPFRDRIALIDKVCQPQTQPPHV